MKLGQVLPFVDARYADCEITGLSADSRMVQEGFAFFALAGVKQNGSAFIEAAIRAGAKAIIHEGEALTMLAPSVADIQVANARHALAIAAARFYPKQPETLVAVTGTAGKTSVADFTRQIFAYCKHNAASLGTIGVVRADAVTYGALTTPDPVQLHQTLDALAGEGVTHLAMEASSHGLDQHRLDGVRLKAAAFTNLGHDHLDYHATIEAYLAAKLRLFDTLLPSDGVAVVNMDSPEGVEVVRVATARGIRCLTVGLRGQDLKLNSTDQLAFDQKLVVEWQGKRFEILLPLAGAFQASNAIVAAGLALAVGEKANDVFEALRQLRGVKGRLERVAEVNKALILVDYAHKPEALEQALIALRPFASGRLICVFGCGGDRDRAKRPIMGEIARRLADEIIITDDNPRSEDPASIRQSILAACPGARDIGDRFAAIKAGVEMLRAGDVLLIAGKGHETGQMIGQTILPFSDHSAIQSILEEKRS
ncbi:MAG: UDP-N-acetylmuramoyl-L-alanyl-D-glutamate--2,6-diaminopimelate ligase [Beijerinckiaceae bacterium]|nr:UDP-N-acetylmuramoyl-L-alanyl-D-glutamate--2,6-diaminopimelate ligase [Beijerinckiaceae bacterium]